ncbi:MAG: hypothetical protein WC570_05185 [Patescibacteria group bacterium]
MAKKIFRGQQEGEEVVAIFRKHWLSFLKSALIFVVLFIISVIILWYWQSAPIFLLVVGLVILLVAISYFTHSFLIWWWDVYLLTDRRVINFDQKSIFHHVVSEADLGNIQDTTYEIEGVWQTFFNYGRVRILTASNGQSIVFESVPSPHVVQEMIMQTKENTIQKSKVKS